MTESGSGAPRFAPAPEIAIPETVATGSGIGVQVPVVIRHQSPVPARLTITLVGLDEMWVPAPLVVGPVEAGQVSQVILEVMPERGALAANYPFVVVVEATPIGSDAKTEMGVAESVLIVDNPDRVTITVDPLQPMAVFSKSIKAHISNPGRTDREITVSSEAARGAAIRLGADNLIIPAGRTVTLKGRITVTRPRLVGHFNSHTFTVSARGLGAPEYVEGSLKSRPVLRGWMTTSIALVLTVALWVGLGLFAIPRISDYLAKTDEKEIVSTETAPADPSAPGTDGAGGTAGADGSADNAAEGDGAGGEGAEGEDPAEEDPADGEAAGVRLAGSITGTKPAGVRVSIEPTNMVEAADEDAAAADGLVGPDVIQGLNNTGPVGKIGPGQIRYASAAPADQERSMESTKDGSWSFAGIKTPGLLLVSFAAPGYQTQRYIVDSALLADAEPMKIEMLAGNGSMSGKVSGPNGPVKGASITLTDGETTVQTSSVSTIAEGADDSVPPGSWQVNGLSTPGTFLVTVSALGYGTASSLVKLDAGGKAVSDIDLTPGVGSIIGQVSGLDEQDVIGGLGGITVTATDGDKITRTATTVTSGPVGRYTLPDLTTPGEYTLTVSGAGFQDQVQQIKIAKGVGATTVDVSMSRTDGVVTGVVSDENGKGLSGAGMTLAAGEVVYKTMTLSDQDKLGSFRFNGVPPGTYVLTASQYGRRSTFATVEITAAGSSTVNMTLRSSPQDELSASGSIKGRVVDARTNGPLTCDRAPDPTVKCEGTVSTYAPTAPAESGKPAGLELVEEPFGQGGDFTLPSADNERFAGLLPGNYTVSISAPGFESTAVQVEVKQGQPTAVPPVALQPLAMLAGTVTTRVGATKTPSCVVLVTSTETPPTACTLTEKNTACVTPSNTDAQCRATAVDGSYEIRGLIAGGYKIVVLPTDVEYIATKPLEVQLDLGESARSDAVLDRWGRAEITVLRPNLNTLALSAAKGVPVTLNRNDDAVSGLVTGVQKAADTTNSQGQIILTGLAGSYTVTAAPPDETAADGQTGVIAVNKTATLDVVVVAPLGPISGRIVTNIDNKILPVKNAAVTVSGVVGFTGRTPVTGSAIVVTDDDGCYAIVPVGWGNKAAPAAPDCAADKVVQVPGESNPVGVLKTGPDAAEPDELSSLVTRQVSLNVRELNTDRTFGYDAADQLVATEASSKKNYVPTVVLGTQPRPFGDQKLFGRVPDGSGGSTDTGVVDDAVITVIKRAAGSGAVGVTVTPSSTGGGVLTWQDSTLTEVNKVIPGRYTLQVSKVGYQNGTIDVWCDLGQECVLISLDTVVKSGDPKPPAAVFSMSQLPRITGTVKANSDLLGSTTITTIEAPAGVGIVKVTVEAQTATDTNNDGQIDADDLRTGIVRFTDSNLIADNNDTRGLARPGKYIFTVALKGYETQTVTVQCLPSFEAEPGVGDPPIETFTAGCQPFDVNLIRLPTFEGKVSIDLEGLLIPRVGSAPTAATVEDVSVALTAAPAPGMNIAITVDEDAGGDPGDPPVATLLWQDSTLLAQQILPGTYTLTFSLAGYVTETRTFTCVSGGATCGPAANADGTGAGDPVVVFSLPQPKGYVTIPSDPAWDWTRSTVTIVSGPAGTAAMTVKAVACPTAGCRDLNNNLVAPTSGVKMAALQWRDPNLPVDGTVREGEYSITVANPGYVTSDVYTFVCTKGGYCGPKMNAPTGSDAFPTFDPIALVPNAMFEGQLDANPALPTSDEQRRLATFQVVNLTSGIGPVTLTSSASGVLSWSEAGVPAGLVSPGQYRITVSLTGYTGETQTVDYTACNRLVDSDNDAQTADVRFCPKLTMKVSKASTLSIVVKNADNPSKIVGGPQISLVGVQLAQNTVTAAPSTNTVNFPELSTSEAMVGTLRIVDGYKVTVRAAGFQTISVKSPANPDDTAVTTGVVCYPGTSRPAPEADQQPVAELRLFAGGTTTCEVTLQTSGVFGGNTKALVPTNEGGSTGVVNGLPGVALSITNANASAESFPGTSGVDGDFAITGTNTIEGLKDGTWNVTASLSGYKSVTGTITILNKKPRESTPAEAAANPFLTVSPAGRVTILLSVIPTTLKVSLFTQAPGATVATPVVSDVSVTLTKDSAPKICKLPPEPQPAPAPGTTDPCTLPTATDSSLYIANLYPGIYTLRVTPYGNKYQGVTTSIQINAGTTSQDFTLNIDTRSSTVTGKVVLDSAPNMLVEDALVKLTESANTNTAALNLLEQPMSMSTESDGLFEFKNVPDGIYRLVVTKEGFTKYISGELTFQSSSNPTPALITVSLGASQRQVSIILSTSLGLTYSLAGTKVTLSRTGLGAGETATPIVATVVSRPQGWTAIYNNVPIGEYEASITTMPGHLFEPGDYKIAVSVPEPDPDLPQGQSPPIIEANLDINETAVTLTAKWTANTCFTTNPSNGPSGVAALITADGSAAAYPVQALAVAGTQATKTVLVPGSRDYAFTLTPTEDFFSTVTGSFTTGDVGTPVNPAALTLLPDEVPVRGHATIDSANTSALTISAVNGSTTVTGTNTNSAGNTNLCLTPGVEWTFSITRTAAPPVLLPSQTYTPTLEPDASANVVNFAGRTIKPSAAVELVPGRNLAVNATVTVTDNAGTPIVVAGNTIAIPLTIASGGTSATGTGWVLPVATYKMSVVQTDTAVVYAPVSSTVLADGTAELEMEYTKVVARFKVQDALGADLEGAAVTAKIPSTATAGVSMGSTDASGLTPVKFDLEPGTWGINATKTGYETQADTEVTPAVGVPSDPVQALLITLTITPPPPTTTTTTTTTSASDPETETETETSTTETTTSDTETTTTAPDPDPETETTTTTTTTSTPDPDPETT